MRLRSLLWMASTPIALTLLMAAPEVRAQREAPSAEPQSAAPEETKEGEEHEVVANPIQNFANFSYKGKDVHGGPYEEGDHKMPPPFSMALLNFAALVFIVGKFFAPGVAKMTRDRHDEIAKNLAESAKLRDEAKRKLEEYSSRLAGLDKEIAAITAEIRAEAEAEKQRILDDAQARADRMAKDAEQQIAADLARVRVELEREAVLAAVGAAERILREKTSDADQRGLVDGFIKTIGKTTAAGSTTT